MQIRIDGKEDIMEMMLNKKEFEKKGEHYEALWSRINTLYTRWQRDYSWFARNMMRLQKAWLNTRRKYVVVVEEEDGLDYEGYR